MEQNVTPEDERIMIKEWSLTMRFNHWATVLCISVLIGTGMYIARPFTVYQGETIDKFMMGDIRFVHILFGVFMVFLFLQRVYLAFFSTFHKDWRDFWSWTELKDLWQQIKFYMLITEKMPKHKYLYGPMQSLAYMGYMVMAAFICVTGLILMGAGYDAGLTAAVYAALKPLENAMGGLAMVRWIHHILTWLFIIFIVVHIYMAFWYDQVFKEGTVSSMINGRVYRKKLRTE